MEERVVDVEEVVGILRVGVRVRASRMRREELGVTKQRTNKQMTYKDRETVEIISFARPHVPVLFGKLLCSEEQHMLWKGS
jgi:hypothetical protein